MPIRIFGSRKVTLSIEIIEILSDRVKVKWSTCAEGIEQGSGTVVLLSSDTVKIKYEMHFNEGAFAVDKTAGLMAKMTKQLDSDCS